MNEDKKTFANYLSIWTLLKNGKFKGRAKEGKFNFMKHFI